jgi:hypothetical protein
MLADILDSSIAQLFCRVKRIEPRILVYVVNFLAVVNPVMKLPEISPDKVRKVCNCD